MRSSFPILSDVSRLLYYDILEIKSSSSYTRSVVADEPSFFKESQKMKKHICYFVGVETTQMLASYTSSFTFEVLNNVSSLFNTSKEGVMATNSSLKQLFIYVDYFVTNTYFLNPKMSICINSTFLKSTCLLHSPISNDLEMTMGKFIQIINTSNLWTLKAVNSIIRNVNTQPNELSIHVTLASLDNKVEQVVSLESSTLSTLKSFDTLDGRSLPSTSRSYTSPLRHLISCFIYRLR